MNDDTLLGYAKEIGVPSLTIDTLIRSHRRLRQDALQTNDVRRREMDECRERVAAQTRESILHGEYIAVSRLRAMTIQELCEFIELWSA